MLIARIWIAVFVVIVALGIGTSPIALAQTGTSISTQSEHKPVLGVEFDTVDSRPRVVIVHEGTAAHRAGLAQGDVITIIDGVPITSADQFVRIVGESQNGQTRLFQVARGDVLKYLPVTFAEIQAAHSRAGAQATSGPSESTANAAVAQTVASLSPKTDSTLKWARLAESQTITQRAISDKGKFVAVGTEAGVIAVYDGYSGDLVFAAQADDVATSSVSILKFSPSGRFLYVKVGLGDGLGQTDAIWDLVQKKDVSPPAASFTNFQFSPNEKYIGGRSGKSHEIFRFETTDDGSKFKLHQYIGSRFGPKWRWEFAPDSKSFVLHATNGFATMNLETERASVLRPFSDRHCCGALAFSPNGQIIASSSRYSSAKQQISLWDARSGRLIRRIDFQAAARLNFSSDGQKLLASSALGPGGYAKVLDVSSGRLLLDIAHHPDSHFGWPFRFTLSDRFLIGSDEAHGINYSSTYRGIWDAETGAPIPKEHQFDRIYLSKDGLRMVAAPVNGNGIVIGDSITTLGLSRNLSVTEREQELQEARSRTDGAIARRQAALDERARGMARIERERRRQRASNPSILGAILQGASNALTDYNQREYAKRQAAQRQADLNRRLTYGTGSSSSSGTSSGTGGSGTADSSSESYQPYVKPEPEHITLLCWGGTPAPTRKGFSCSTDKGSDRPSEVTPE